MQAGPSNHVSEGGRFYINEEDEMNTMDSVHAGRTSSGTDGISRYASSSKAIDTLDVTEDVSDVEGEEIDRDSDDLSTTSGRRHGALLLPEEADMVLYESQYMTQWTQKRHQTGGNPKPHDERDLPDWRMRERLRTVTAALVMCLNIGVDPPDISKTNPCSKLICWMDPSSIEVSKALPAIGRNLQAQFETLSMKTRYKQYLDPIVEETKRFCTSLRRTAKDERVLFYYNGFGVPKPTPGGEIWVFNKAYTQYIPVTLYDLQAWLGNPCIFVWDSSSAGNVVVNFKRLAERRAEEEARASGGPRARSGSSAAAASAPTTSFGEDQQFPLRESIHLAACGPDEVLPMNPDLPADLFTCCLTSPIEISLRWFVLQNPLPSQLNVDMVMNIPGRLQDRRTPLGELNWIFTAITDTIAWTVLPRTIFRRLFRDDLMVAALLRNFLLAERIMRFYHCTPMSHPKLPATHNHPLWDSWDLAVDQCLSQLPTLLAKEEAARRAAQPDGPPMEPHLAAYEYRHSTFFSEQLMAFEVWLSQGGVSRRGRRRRVDASKTLESHIEEAEDEDEDEDEEARAIRSPPDQLPIVLQVLLSQVHRLRALILLSQFLDLGPWAVNMALSIGIFPYVLKLLQSPAADLKPVLIYIWARILAVDRSCQNDLLRDNGFVYFSTVLSPFQQPAQQGGAGGPGNANNHPIPNVSEHRAMCAFILAVFCQDFPAGQQACLQTDAMDSCLEHLDHDDFLLRQWSALCIGQLWDNSSMGKARGVGRDVHGKFACMLSDISPEVRAAVLYAMGTLLGASGSSYDAEDRSVNRHAQAKPLCLGTGTMLEMDESRQRSLEVGIAVSMLSTRSDPSSLVRKELVIALSPFVREYQGFFVLVAYLYYDREERKLRQRNVAQAESVSGLDADTVAYEEALLTRIVTKLSLEEGLDEVDIANIPAFSTLFVSLLDLSADSHPEVASLACTVVDYINALMLTLLPPGQMGGATSADRMMTPTSTAEPREGYFPPMPRSKMSTANNRANDASGLGLGRASSFGNLNASRSSPHGTGNHHHPHYNRRSTSLAQTVKAIATLGYSRPASPSNEESDSHDSAHRSSNDAPHRSAFLPPRVPAPRRQSTRYVSPFVPVADGRSRRSSDAHDSSDSATASTITSAAHRSASAESLAQIARMQERRTARQSSSSTQPNTPVVGSRAQLHTTGLTPTHAHRTSGSYDHSPTVSGPHSRSRSPFSETGLNHKIADALASIVAVDLQRFRDRHLIADENAEAHFISMAGHTPMHSPGGGQLDGGQTIREVLPLKSSLFAWCSEYYTEPQMKCAEADEPGSVQYNIQTWKRERNERLMSEAQADVDNVVRAPWTQSAHVSTLPTASSTAPGVQIGAPAYLMRLHQFENHLITASEQDTISVWDWTSGKLLTRFNNGNPPKTSITSMAFVNEDAQTRFLVGSADGDVRVYANYDEPSWSAGRGPKLVSSMRALPHLVRSKRPSGLVFDWQQISGSLLTGGDSRFIRVWDAHRELCICDIPTRVSSCITSISSETDVGHVFVCGFGDGTIGVYDRRIPPELSLVRLWEEHSNWITNVHLQKRGNRELVSASTDGVVKVWDIRGRNSLKSKDWSGEMRGKLSAMDVHDGAPIFAISSYPKPQRSGMGVQRTLLCNIETQEVLSNTRPIDRQFATSFEKYAQANTATGAGHSSNDSTYQHGLSGHGTSSTHGGIHQHVGHSAVLSPAIDSPPSYFRPGMGSMAFHPHFPLLAFAGPDSLGFVGLTRSHMDTQGGKSQGKSGYATSQSTASSSNGSVLTPYSYIGYGGYGHGAASILDGDDQRHIPSLPSNTADIPRSKSLFGLVG